MLRSLKGLCWGLAVVVMGAAMVAVGEARQQAASPSTKTANAAMSAQLDWTDKADFDRAARGFKGTRSDPKILDAEGKLVFDLEAYAFAAAPAPETANPSLWRQLQLLSRHGLFEVVDGIYQVRGFDISNITFIRTQTGWIVVDPLTTAETAKAAFALVTEKLGARPIQAVIYTHSHADHFGGVKGIVEQSDVDAGRVQIIAPEGFLEHAVSENLIAGPAMSRRATYQFGSALPRSPTGQLGAGIGPGIPTGSITLIPPTRTIKRTGETLTIDGVIIEFQVTPGTEAPAEMNFYLPQFKALCLAENANATMHNILPPRGALVRDAKAWADYLTESIALFRARTDVVFLVHTWPRWGKSDVGAFMEGQRDAYKFLHDQSVRLMNKGLTGAEIAEQITLAPELARAWFNRGYYGTMRHNARAVYQRYLGWYDANPARLNALPPEDSARRYVDALGGAQRVLQLVQSATQQGDYRWAAELGAHLVFAEPQNAEAKAALAMAYEQMGFQAESMLWRNMYLSGARELREGVAERAPSTVSLDMLAATTTPMLLDLLAIRIDPEKAAGRDLSLRFVFPDTNERVRVTLKNRVLVYRVNDDDRVQLTVTMARANFLRVFFQGADGRAMVLRGEMKLDGDASALQAFGAALDRSAPNSFPIVTP